MHCDYFYNYNPIGVHCWNSMLSNRVPLSGACPGIRKRGGPKSESLFFLLFNFSGGGPAQKLAEKMMFSTKKVAKYKKNSLIFALMTFFFCFSISRGVARPLGPPPPWTRACLSKHLFASKLIILF